MAWRQGISGADDGLRADDALQAVFGARQFGQSPEQQAATRADHDGLLRQLGIERLRPGANGNPSAPDAANADEAKATYSKLPDPLVFENGRPVRNAGDWRRRRAEILEIFDREVYGKPPKNLPKVTWRVAETTDETIGAIPAVTQKLVGVVDNRAFPGLSVEIALNLTTPKSVRGRVPCVLEFGFVFPAGAPRPTAPRPGVNPNAPRQNAGPSWQEQVLSRGWACAVLAPTSFQADNGAGLRSGIIGLVNRGQPRKPDDWGALRAWAWGASRVLDHFKTHPNIDARRVAIEGLSRYGKASLVSMAYDERFAIGFIGSSGAGGAKLLRRDFGEKVENLAGSGEYHWMGGNFLKYAGPKTPADLPVDAHQLLAACAPRPVFVSCGSPFVEGNWVDSRGQFLATVAAGPVYKLLGKRDLGTDAMPAIESGLMGGDLAFRQHAGGHTVGPNWPFLLDFAARYWK